MGCCAPFAADDPKTRQALSQTPDHFAQPVDHEADLRLNCGSKPRIAGSELFRTASQQEPHWSHQGQQDSALFASGQSTPAQVTFRSQARQVHVNGEIIPFNDSAYALYPSTSGWRAVAPPTNPSSPATSRRGSLKPISFHSPGS